MADEEGEHIGYEVAGAKGACTLIKSEKVGTNWKATVKCSNGSTKTATSANKNQSKVLACMQCDE